MSNIFRSFSVTISLVVLVGLLGCSTLDRNAAAKLAGEGKSWAATVRTTQSDTSAGLNQYIESQILVAEIGGRGALPGDGEMDAIKHIKLVLAARMQIMEALISTYGSFEKLASYNAADEVETALNGLTSSINNYATQLNANESPASVVAGVVVGKVGGFTAGEVQKHKLLKSSQLIRTQLTRLQPLIDREISTQDRMRTLIIEGNAAAATTLVGQGLGDPAPMLKSVLSDFGLAYNPAQGLAMMKTKNARILSALSKIVENRAGIVLSVQKDLLVEVKTSLGELAEAHARFERGEPLSAENLTQRIIFLRQFLEEINKLKT